MKTLLTAAVTSAFFVIGATQAHALTTTIYDGTQGTPGSQFWSYGNTGGTETSSSNGTTLDTTANDNIKDGYARFGLSLNRNTGYNLRFDLQLIDENHSNPSAQNNTGTDTIADRAGLSIIALSSDRRGIELGFWLDEIWAQQDGAVKADPVSAPTETRFTHAEGASFNTNQGIAQYDLSILGDIYYLYANRNYAVPLLKSSLRDYTLEGTPYTTSNFLFIGDNTTSARGSFKLARVELSNAAIVPVPFAFNPLFGVGIFGLSQIRKAIRQRESAKQIHTTKK